MNPLLTIQPGNSFDYVYSRRVLRGAQSRNFKVRKDLSQLQVALQEI